MKKSTFNLLGVVLCLLAPQFLHANWINFNDETSTRLELSSVPASDGEEKDISVADLNKDGWTDVIVVRRNPFSVQGAGTDLLLLNDQGTLKDSTSKYAPGFINTPSDSRDIVIADFDGDTWEDVIMVNTFSQQPIYYHNLGNNAQGEWLGLSDSSSVRFPVLTVSPIQFCAGWAGDVNGNGSLDLYLVNYAQSGGSEDVLLINDGSGHFTDETASRMGSLRRSAFGTSGEIYDMDNDGDNDIIKISTLYSTFPWFDNGVFVLFNDGSGNFSNWQMMTSTSPYMFTVGDLNNDNKLDMYVVDDNQDYVNLSTSFDADTFIFHTNSILSNSPRTTAFGGNIKMADLDGDGDLDVCVASADLDIPPCESGGARKFAILRNDGLHSGVISDPFAGSTNVWNNSNYDFGFLDVNNDGKMDVFSGDCSSYKVYMQEYLATPANLSAIAGFDDIAISWDPNTEGFLSSYNLYRSTYNDPDSAGIIVNLAAPASSYSDQAVASGVTYYYWLVAVDTLGFETGLSNLANAMYSANCVYVDSNSLNVTNITATSVTLNWTPDPDAVRYELRGKVPGAATWITLVVNSTTGIFNVVDLFPNTTFIWQLKKTCQLSPLEESLWTPLDTFTTLALPICSIPNPVSTTNITISSADLNWTAVPDATGYQILGQAIGSSTIVTLDVSPLLTTFVAGALPPATSFVWAVRTRCSAAQTQFSDVSTILSFTTLANSEKGLQDLQFIDSYLDMGIYPNPTSGIFGLEVISSRRTKANISIVDLTGKEVFSDALKVEEGLNTLNIEIKSPGVYFVKVNSNKSSVTRKLIVN